MLWALSCYAKVLIQSMNEDEEFADRPIRAFAGAVHSEKTHGREAKIGTRTLDRFTTPGIAGAINQETGQSLKAKDNR